MTVDPLQPLHDSDPPASPTAQGSTATVRSLRSLIGTPMSADVQQHALQLCDDLGTQLDQVGHEAEGIGLELLRAYEQLGIVFQLARSLASARNRNDILRAFIGCLRSAYASDGIALVFLESGGFGMRLHDESQRLTRTTIDDQSRRLAERSRSEKKSLVEGQEGTRQVISAPIFCGDEFVCAVQVDRRGGGSGNERNMPADGAASHHSARAADDSGTPGLDSGDMQILDSLVTFCGDLLQNVSLLEALRQASIDTVRALVSAVDQKDPYTSGHSTRVGFYALLLGRRLELDEETLQMLHWSALLHDVGKIGIREEVLKKPGRLTAEEFEHMKEHPRRGYEVVRGIPHFANALDGILHHHERYDGSGYPEGLAGEHIPLKARIIQIADVFDALTTTRAYRTAFDWRDALGIMEEEAGTVSDPHLARTFNDLLFEHYGRNPRAFEWIGKKTEPPPFDPLVPERRA